MPTLTEDIELVRKQLREWHSRTSYPFPGVPPEMRVDPTSTEEWQEWKLIDVAYELTEVESLEAKLPVPLPQYFKAFMLSYHTMNMDFGEYSLPESWSDRPLARNFGILLDPSFWEAGYLQIGNARGCGDPLLLDFQSVTGNDYAVTIFNHDVVPHEVMGDRTKLKPYESFIAPSFREFFRLLLNQDTSIFPAPTSAEEQRRNVAWEEVEQLLAQQGLPRYHRPKEVPSTDPWAIAEFLRKRGSTS
jgi:hypothetical protein